MFSMILFEFRPSSLLYETLIDYKLLLDPLLNLCHKAGRYILHKYQDLDSIQSSIKLDASPVTSVDLAVHSMLQNGLSTMAADIPILSEESTSSELSDRLNWDRFWMIDPLDGTREFLSKTGDFTINVALIEHGRPILGVVHLPLRGCCYVGIIGAGAWKFSDRDNYRNGSAVRMLPSSQSHIGVLASRGNAGLAFDSYFSWLKIHCSRLTLFRFGAAVKFAELLENQADIYPRFSACSEWDVAAGDTLLHAAGGKLVGLDGLPILYNARDTLICQPFLAFRDFDLPLWIKSLEFLSS